MEEGAEPDWKDYQSVFTNSKAGMEQVDKEKVKKIVYDMSKDSAHFKNEQRKQANVDAKVQKLKQQAVQLTPAQLSNHVRSMDAKIALLEVSRNLSRVWLHVDMDAFYCSVEELDDPTLRDVPMAVGGIGMICTANYQARKFGVRSAMPGFIAKKLCPSLVFVPTNFTKYTAVSEQTRAVFRCYDPDFEAGSLDEVYMDVTGYCQQHGVTGAEVAEEIRRRIRDEVRVTCSCGVAPNKMLAKVCSDLNKPDGQYVLPANREAVVGFISTLAIRKVPFIGKVTEQTLSALGIHTCKELLDQRGLVEALFTPKATDFFLRSCLGLGETHHPPKVAADEPWRKGISCERTFRALSDPKLLEAKLQELVTRLAEQMAEERIEGKTLTLKLKATSFHVITRATTLTTFASKPQDMLPPLLSLLRAELPIELRLMGARASNLRKIGAAAAAGSLEHFIARANARQLAGTPPPSPGTPLEEQDCPSPQQQLTSPRSSLQQDGRTSPDSALEQQVQMLPNNALEQQAWHLREQQAGQQQQQTHLQQAQPSPGPQVGCHADQPDQDLSPVELTLNDWQTLCMSSSTNAINVNSNPICNTNASASPTPATTMAAAAANAATTHLPPLLSDDSGKDHNQQLHISSLASSTTMHPCILLSNDGTENHNQPFVKSTDASPTSLAAQDLHSGGSSVAGIQYTSVVRLGCCTGVDPSTSICAHMGSHTCEDTPSATTTHLNSPSAIAAHLNSCGAGNPYTTGASLGSCIVHKYSCIESPSTSAAHHNNCHGVGQVAHVPSIGGARPYCHHNCDGHAYGVCANCPSNSCEELGSVSPSHHDAWLDHQHCAKRARVGNPCPPLLKGPAHSAQHIQPSTSQALADAPVTAPNPALQPSANLPGSYPWMPAAGRCDSEAQVGGAVKALDEGGAVKTSDEYGATGPYGWDDKVSDQHRPFQPCNALYMQNGCVRDWIDNMPEEHSSPKASPTAASAGTAAKGSWTCTVCTFAGNLLHQLRCDVCDALRAGLLSWEAQDLAAGAGGKGDSCPRNLGATSRQARCSSRGHSSNKGSRRVSHNSGTQHGAVCSGRQGAAGGGSITRYLVHNS